MRQGLSVNVVGEQFALEVHTHDARQVCLAHLVIEPCPGATVRQLASSGKAAGVLRIKLARPKRRLFLQCLNALVALGSGFSCGARIVRHHQSKLVPCDLPQYLG